MSSVKTVCFMRALIGLFVFFGILTTQRAAASTTIVTMYVSAIGPGRLETPGGGPICGKARSCKANFVIGRSIEVVGEPDEGWAISSWQGVCSGTRPEGHCFFVASPDRIMLSANFGKRVSPPQNPKLYLTNYGVGKITVKPKGKSCGAQCYQFELNTNIIIRAIPKRPRRKASWDGDCEGSQLTCRLIMDEDKSAGVAMYR
jgi:hypothetical protein